jgi:predicted HTH transcriptional regulator
LKYPVLDKDLQYVGREISEDTINIYVVSTKLPLASAVPRNRELMRVFRDLEFVEQIGSGMSRILKAYDREVFELSPSFTVVTLLFEKAFSSLNGKMIGKINDKTQTTLDVIKDNPTATIAMLAELKGKSQRTISRELKEYQDADLIHREGAEAFNKMARDLGDLETMRQDFISNVPPQPAPD